MGALAEFLGSVAFKGGLTLLQMLVSYSECGLDGGFCTASATWGAVAPILVWLFIICLAIPIGGQLNPSLSMCLWAGRKQSLGTTVAYIALQCAGAVAACFLLKSGAALLGAEALFRHIGKHSYALPLEQAWLHEAASAGGLIFALLAVGELFHGCDRLNPVVTASAVVAFVVNTGASMDPAAQLHGAFFAGELDSELVVLYWSAALTGAGIASFVYTSLLEGKLPSEKRHPHARKHSPSRNPPHLTSYARVRHWQVLPERRDDGDSAPLPPRSRRRLRGSPGAARL